MGPSMTIQLLYYLILSTQPDTLSPMSKSHLQTSICTLPTEVRSCNAQKVKSERTKDFRYLDLLQTFFCEYLATSKTIEIG